MKRRFPDLVCAKCGSNKLTFPRSADDQVTCDDCGQQVATLAELQARVVEGPGGRESRSARAKRHAAEVADSHDRLRASVAETDRLILESNDMLSRHRKENEDAGD